MSGFANAEGMSVKFRLQGEDELSTDDQIEDLPLLAYLDGRAAFCRAANADKLTCTQGIMTQRLQELHGLSYRWQGEAMSAQLA